MHIFDLGSYGRSPVVCVRSTFRLADDSCFSASALRRRSSVRSAVVFLATLTRKPWLVVSAFGRGVGVGLGVGVAATFGMPIDVRPAIAAVAPVPAVSAPPAMTRPTHVRRKAAYRVPLLAPITSLPFRTAPNDPSPRQGLLAICSDPDPRVARGSGRGL